MEALRASKAAMNDIGRHIETHAAAVERLAVLEAEVGDVTRRHQADLKAASDRIDRMAGQCEAFDALRQGHADLQRELSAHGRQQASQLERLEELKETMGEAAEEQSRRLEAVKAAQSKLVSENRGASQQQASLSVRLESAAAAQGLIEDRVAQAERKIDDSVDRHSREFATIRECHNSHLQSKHAPLEEELQALKRAASTSADKQASSAAQQQEHLQALHEKLSAEQALGLERASELSAQREDFVQHRAHAQQKFEALDRSISEAAAADELGKMKSSCAELDGTVRTLKGRLDKLGNLLSGNQSPRA